MHEPTEQHCGNCGKDTGDANDEYCVLTRSEGVCKHGREADAIDEWIWDQAKNEKDKTRVN